MAWELVETQTKRGDQLSDSYTYGYQFSAVLATNYGGYPSELYYYVTINFLKASSSYVSAAVFDKLVRQFNFNYFRYKFELSVNGSRLFDQIVEIGRTTGGTIKEVPFTLERRLDSDVYTVNLYREVKNTAPTTPGVFTQPTGTLEIGDTKAISWGSSTDADGNLHGYEFEVSVDGGSWINRGFATTPSFSYVIPTATTIKFRVRARDNAGLYSAYRESPVYTVSKPIYYWSKYNVITSDYEDVIISTDSSQIFSTTDKFYFSYIFNKLTGRFIGEGTGYAYSDISQVPIGYYYIGSRNDLAIKVTSRDSSNIRGEWHSARISYSRGKLVQSNITAIEETYPTDGKHTDGYWYVRGSRVSQSIAPPEGFISPQGNIVWEPRQVIPITVKASTASNISIYEVQSQYNEGAWQNVGTHTNSLTRSLTVTEDKTLKTVTFRARVKNTSNIYSDYIYSETFQIQHNKVPTLTLETEGGKTLYEKDTFAINGNAQDLDIGDIVSVYYKINNGQPSAIATKISEGEPFTFNELLTFKSGKLFKGENEVTGVLKEGETYSLEVWATDNQEGKSEVSTRSFYVVPNRPPTLTIDPIEDAAALISTDKVLISGEAFDPDGNDVRVTYKINNRSSTQILDGPAGKFNFDVQLSRLDVGENIITVEVSDTYDFKASRNIFIEKNEDFVPLTNSVQMYEITPPAGTAQNVLMWIELEDTQDITVEISMTNGTEQEDFKPMTLDTSGPTGIGRKEDFYEFKADAPKNKIAIKISWSGEKPIFQITGALLQ